MPYIKQELRPALDKHLTPLFAALISAGDFNYVITKICKSYIDREGENYDLYNTLVGVLECAKLELYRRKTAPYENIKIKQNGDAY